MPVPEHIRKVKRPINTVVLDSGRDTPKRYSVVERSYVKYVRGGNPQPHNGAVVGHIIDGVFVPKSREKTTPANPEPASLSYGSSALVKSVSADLLSDLLQVYDCRDAFAIMAIASLRVIRPRITMHRFSTHYKRTFISKFYPGIGISANTVTKLFTRIGMCEAKRLAFYARRWESVAKDHHVAIDGSLVQDNSVINDLSSYSRKARVKGTKDISLLYAYDIEKLEPICARVFPGNCIDAQAYREFVRVNNVTKGILISDKGFPPKQIRAELKERPDLHYLTPIKKNDKRIHQYDLLKFESILPGIEDQIQYRKQALESGLFLYAFKDVRRAAASDVQYNQKAKESGEFDFEKYSAEKEHFGAIIFESDLDLDPKTIYACYSQRWLIELAFRRYKSDEGLDRTGAQNDFTVIGSEFISFISTVISCRIAKKMADVGLLDNASYGDIMEDLSVAWRYVDAPKEAVSHDGGWIHPLEKSYEAMEALGISKSDKDPKPERGNRRSKTKPVFVGPKRPRGRPRKVKTEESKRRGKKPEKKNTLDKS